MSDDQLGAEIDRVGASPRAAKAAYCAKMRLALVLGERPEPLHGRTVRPGPDGTVPFGLNKPNYATIESRVASPNTAMTANPVRPA